MSRHRAASLARASQANGSEPSEWMRGAYAVAGAATTWAIDCNGSKDEKVKYKFSDNNELKLKNRLLHDVCKQILTTLVAV